MAKKRRFRPIKFWLWKNWNFRRIIISLFTPTQISTEKEERGKERREKEQERRERAKERGERERTTKERRDKKIEEMVEIERKRGG